MHIATIIALVPTLAFISMMIYSITIGAWATAYALWIISTIAVIGTILTELNIRLHQRTHNEPTNKV